MKTSKHALHVLPGLRAAPLATALILMALASKAGPSADHSDAPDREKHEKSVVKSLNGLSGDVSLLAGSNVTIAPAGNGLVVSAQPSGVTTLNGAAGDLVLAAGTNISITTISNRIQIGNTGGGENLRIVRGYVDLDGTVLVGTGFTAARVCFPPSRPPGYCGSYVITFDPPFSAPPVVTVTALAPASSGDILPAAYVNTYFPPDTNAINITTTDLSIIPGGTPVIRPDYRDEAFSFIAIGPR